MDVQMEKTLKGKSQTIPFNRRALTSITHGKYMVNPAPQISAIPKNTELTEKSGKAEWPEQQTPLATTSPVLAHLNLEEVWNTTPVFHQTFYKPASIPLQANDGRLLAFDAGETENKTQDRKSS